MQGVGRLSQPAYDARPPVAMPVSRSRPRRAAVFAIIPGLGAVYNRQNVKALAHFVAIVGLFQMADITNLAFFGVAGMVFWAYSILDAYRTAEALQAGVSSAEDEERLRRMLQENTVGWGLLLVGIGTLFFVSNLNIFQFQLEMRRLWPVILIGAGVYLIRDHFKRARFQSSDFMHRPPKSVVSGSLAAGKRLESAEVERERTGAGKIDNG